LGTIGSADPLAALPIATGVFHIRVLAALINAFILVGVESSVFPSLLLALLAGQRRRDRDFTIIGVIVALRSEDTTHCLDLSVLDVDDLLADDVEDAGGTFFVLEVFAVCLTRKQKGLAHIHGVLVVWDHLMVEQGDSIVSVHVGRHALHHSTVHRIDTRGELADRSAGCVADELVGTLGIWKLEVF